MDNCPANSSDDDREAMSYLFTSAADGLCGVRTVRTVSSERMWWGHLGPDCAAGTSKVR
jgi:hypothetical protein